jgi:hypothetical protein
LKKQSKVIAKIRSSESKSGTLRNKTSSLLLKTWREDSKKETRKVIKYPKITLLTSIRLKKVKNRSRMKESFSSSREEL